MRRRPATVQATEEEWEKGREARNMLQRLDRRQAHK